MSAFDFDGGSHGSPPDVLCKAPPMVRPRQAAGAAAGVAAGAAPSVAAAAGNGRGGGAGVGRRAKAGPMDGAVAGATEAKQARLSEPGKVSKFFQKKDSSLKQRYLASYNHRPWSAGSGGAAAVAAAHSSAGAAAAKSEDLDDDDDEPEDEDAGVFVVPAPVAPPPLLFRRSLTAPSGTSSSSSSSATPAGPFPSVRVRHVKAAAEVAERGEQQSFADDVRYLMDGLGPDEPAATRLLSLLQCVEHCANSQEFRLHLKAHRLHPSLFRLLGATDLPETKEPWEPQLTLGTAALFYALSRDRATLLLDKPGLGLLLRLLDTPDRPQLADRVRQRLRSIFPCVGPELLTSARRLAMQTLLSLGIRRASPWFKEEIRRQRGLDHALDSLRDDLDYFGDDLGPQQLNEFMVARLERVREFLSLLENMSYRCPANQQHLVGLCQPLLLRLVRLCSANRGDATATSPATACLLGGLKLLINLSHNNAQAADLLTSSVDGGDLLAAVSALALDCGEDPPAVTSGADRNGGGSGGDARFDLTLLSLGVLINLAEHSDENQSHVSRLPRLVERLAGLFNVRFLRACSHELEAHLPDSAGVGASATGGAGLGDDSDENGELGASSEGGDLEFGRGTAAAAAAAAAASSAGGLRGALSRAGEHMEDSIVAAYAGLLLCCLAQRNVRLAASIRPRLQPQPSFLPVLSCITKFLSFLTLAGSGGTQEDRLKSQEEAESIARLVKAVSRVEDVIREQDRRAAGSAASDGWAAAASAGRSDPSGVSSGSVSNSARQQSQRGSGGRRQ